MDADDGCTFGEGIAKKGVGLGIPYLDFLKLQLISIFAFIVSIPVAGRLADSRGRKRTLSIRQYSKSHIGLIGLFVALQQFLKTLEP